MTNQRMKELLIAAVNHIEGFEEDMSDSVLQALGFTKGELAEINDTTQSKEKGSKYVDGFISYHDQVIWMLTSEGSEYIFSDQKEDEEGNWITYCVPFDEEALYIEIRQDGRCTGYAWYNSKENYVEDFFDVHACLKWLVSED